MSTRTIEGLVALRADARKRGDQAGVAAVELALTSLEVQVEDSQEGTKWSRLAALHNPRFHGNQVLPKA